MVGTPKNPPARHKTFGISDSLLDAARQVQEQEIQEAGKGREDVKATQRNVARKSGALRSKDSVASTTTARFKQRHAGDTVSHRPGTQGAPRSTGMAGGKRPIGGMGAVHHDLHNTPEDEFRRKYGKSKSAMRTGLRNEENTKYNFKDSDYQYNKDSWMDALNKVGKDGLQEEVISEESITVEMNAGGTTYKVLSVSKDIGSRIKVGENLTDTHIDDLREMGISISYKGGKGGMKKMEAKEAKDVDADSAAAARKHDCASHIKSEEFGEGVCIPTQHADPDEDGQVEWYDVMFDHGIERVMTEKVAIVKSSSHMHSSKMKKKKAIMGSKMEAKDVDTKNADQAMRHDCATHVKHEEFGEGNPIPGQHTLEETSEGEGIVTHYDVMFAEGIKENVPVEDLEIISEMSHGHAKKKKSVKSGYMMSSKNKMEAKLDPVDPKELKGKHADRDDGDIDNDGDEDSSDKYLHKRRKAIKKAIKKEGVNESIISSKAPGTEQVKDALEAYNLAQHYLQLSNRDALFGREDQQKVNEGFAKQFYEQYKDLKSKGDESADDTFKNEVSDQKIESFSEAEMPQTTSEAAVQEVSRDTLGSYVRKASDAQGHRGLSTKKVDNRYSGVAKASKKIDDMENMPKTQTGSPHKIKPSYDTKTHKLVKVKGKPGLKTVPKDYKIKDGEYEAEEVQYEDQYSKTMQGHMKNQAAKDKAAGMIKMRKSDGDGVHGTTVNRNDKEKVAALKAKGYTQVVEARDEQGRFTKADSTNMEVHAPEVVEYTPSTYDYNRNSWMDALAEVNRYKGRSGHRVTKVSKDGPEHVVMQMRKVMSLGDNHQGVQFNDGSTHKVSKATAQKFLDKYNRSKPEEKEKLQKSASHSHGGLHHAASEKPIEHGPGQDKPSAFKPAARREPTRRLIHPDDRD